MKRGWVISKSAQATIFIVIAIVLVGSVGIMFFLTKATNSFEGQFSSDAEIQVQFNNIRNSVENCMKFTSEDAVELIGIQGGYYESPKDIFNMGWAFIPYYYLEGKFLMPGDADINKQLGLYVNDNLANCFKEIEYFDFRLDYPDKPVTSAIVKPGEILFRIDMPVTITRETKTFRLDLKDNGIVVDSKLYAMLEIAKYVINSHREDPNYLCISCVDMMARERGFYFDMIDFGDGRSTLYVISQNGTETPPIAFEFLNKYPVKAITNIV